MKNIFLLIAASLILSCCAPTKKIVKNCVHKDGDFYECEEP